MEDSIPTHKHAYEGLSLSNVWAVNGWGDPKRMVLPIHAAKKSRPNVVKGPGFKEWLR